MFPTSLKDYRLHSQLGTHLDFAVNDSSAAKRLCVGFVIAFITAQAAPAFEIVSSDSSDFDKAKQQSQAHLLETRAPSSHSCQVWATGDSPRHAG